MILIDNLVLDSCGPDPAFGWSGDAKALPKYYKDPLWHFDWNYYPAMAWKFLERGARFRFFQTV